MRTTLIRVLLSVILGFGFINLAQAITPEQIIAALKRPENSTGNIADAVEEATGARGWMSADMKPIYDSRIVGRAATALMRPVLKMICANTRITFSIFWMRHPRDRCWCM